MAYMHFDTLAQDVRQAWRRLLHDRFFTVAAILILALGIGANTAVFSIVNSVLLRPLVFQEPERLFAIQEVVPQLTQFAPQLPVNAWHYREWKSRCSCFEDVALSNQQEFNLTGEGDPERVSAARVTPNFFSVFGTSAQVGRTFVSEEGQDGKENVVVLSDALWRRRFGGNPSIVGQTIRLNGVSHVVVGVLPPSFRYHLRPTVGTTFRERVDVYKPWPIDKDQSGWVGDHNYTAVARLPRGKTPRQALAELNVIQAEIATRFQTSDGQRVPWDLFGVLVPLQDQVVERGRSGLLLLLAAVGTVLLIACLNLGNLMLVRATARGRDTAILAALGASRGRIFRGVLTESLLLASWGAALGVGLAYTLVRAFVIVAPIDLPRVDEVSIDSHALAFAIVLAVGTALLFGILPAFRLMRADPQESLRTAGRSLTESRSKLRIREGLVAVEVGLSAALLIVAGLLITSFIHLGEVDRGFDAQNVLTAEISLPNTRYPDKEKRREFYRDLTSRIEAQSGVIAAGVISVLPLQGDAWADIVTIEGDTRPLAERPILRYRTVSPNYLRAMGIPLYSGRSIQETDYPRRVAVVSQGAAEKIWRGENPIGKRFRRAAPAEPAFEVLGVTGNVRSTGIDKEPEPIVYVSLWERAPETGSIAIRTSSDSRQAIGILRESVKSLDPDVPIAEIQTMTQIESNSVAQRRLQTLLVLSFAASALVLAALGTYSVLRYSVSRRTNEIGIRMALGAKPADVAMMVLRQGLWPVAIGLGAGIVGALAIGRFLSALLFSVSPRDPATFAIVACVTLAAALVACWIPARRAAKLAPLRALRYE